MSDLKEWDIRHARLLRTVALTISVVTIALNWGILLLLLAHTGFDYWQDSIKDHFLGSIELIGIITTSFGIVIFLRQSEGPIEFEAIGFKLKGAAGQVVLWGFCVIVLSLCAKLLW